MGRCGVRGRLGVSDAPEAKQVQPGRGSVDMWRSSTEVGLTDWECDTPLTLFCICLYSRFGHVVPSIPSTQLAISPSHQLMLSIVPQERRSTRCTEGGQAQLTADT